MKVLVAIIIVAIVLLGLAILLANYMDFKN